MSSDANIGPYMMQRQATVHIMPTPYELARSFWEMDAAKQAMFFAYVSETAGTYLHQQVRSIVEECASLDTGPMSHNGAVRVLETIAGHYEHYKAQPHGKPGANK